MATSNTTPALAAIAGPLEGKTIPLDRDAITVGRDPSSAIHISDIELSRRHCTITRAANGFTISDLKSHNGTFVNNVPVTERELRHGDRIAIGGSIFVVLLEREEAAAPEGAVEEQDDALTRGRVVLEDYGPRLPITAELHTKDSAYLSPGSLATVSGPALDASLPFGRPGAERDLSPWDALFKISAGVGSIRGLDEIQNYLLDASGQATPAQRGAILITEDRLGLAEEFTSARSWRRRPVRDGGKAPAFPVSRTVVRQAIARRTAVLCDDETASGAFAQSDSLKGSIVCSVLCVPLVLNDNVLGAIYLETADPLARFEEADLQLVTAIAAVAVGALDNALQLDALERQNRRLIEDIGIVHRIVGESTAIRQVLEMIAKVAPTDTTVLIEGESGTGKELAAAAIHHNSRRAGRPFVAINCAALTETLLESELFGHERGAFTGAIAQKRGKLELAQDGTVFLDEIGEIAPSMQAKLLRVLQERELERVGGTRVIKMNARLVAATNRNLEDAVARGEFRQDLYYRLNVVSLRMPPLRERREDIPLLAEFFIGRFGPKANRRVRGLSSAARACLLRYNWVGNVRELENAIERAVVMGTSDRILPEDLPEALLESAAGGEVESREGGGPETGAVASHYHDAIRRAKKDLILEALRGSNGSIVEAASALGLHPNYLHRLIRNLDLRPPAGRRAEK